jgi:hypothetical protein
MLLFYVKKWTVNQSIFQFIELLKNDEQSHFCDIMHNTDNISVIRMGGMAWSRSEIADEFDGLLIK